MITSTRNRRVASAVRLKKRSMREKDERFLVEGARVVGEAIASGAHVTEVFHVPGGSGRVEPSVTAARSAGIPVHPVSDEVMAALTSTVTPQGVVAVSAFLDRSLEDAIAPGARCVPVLIHVRDPGNAGTILRSADAAGADAVVFARASVDAYNPKVVRASAGSLFHVPVVRDADPAAAVATLRGRGFTVLAAARNGEHSIEDVPLEGPVALLFGNEAGGLADESIALADVTVRIPIRGRAESLNLAAAASVLLFEVARRNDRQTLAHLVAGAAHDLRSPLTAIRAFAETLRTRWDRLDESGRLAAVEGIEADALRGGRLVARLADAARAASGTLSLTDEPVDVGTEAAEVASEASRTGRQRPEVRTAGSALVRGDRQRVNGLLAALVEGADWWGAAGPVRVAVDGSSPDAVTVTVARSGDPGAHREPAAILSGDAMRASEPGHPGGALLLAVALAVARAHGGRLTVGSAESAGGVSFELRLPRQPVRGGSLH